LKDTNLTLAVEEVVTRQVRAIDKIIEDFIKPLSDVGSPQDIMGKPYAEWTPEDLQRAIMIYGQKSDSPLSRGLTKFYIDRMRQAESEV
jgi:hypothetical protein